MALAQRGLGLGILFQTFRCPEHNLQHTQPTKHGSETMDIVFLTVIFLVLVLGACYISGEYDEDDDHSGW